MRTLALILALVCGPALAQTATCPEAPDHSAEIDMILGDLRVAPDDMAARGLTNSLWRLWTDAPDDRAQDLLDRGMDRRANFDLLGARDILDELVEYCPDYAEGYNQRAFANYLRQDFSAALWDLDRTLELNPTHIGALAGRALALMGMGQLEEGQKALREALELNPWLAERALLIQPEGEEI